MTIHYATAYALPYADADTPLVDLAVVSEQLATEIGGALARGGVAPPGAADLAAEANTRAAADTALGNRVTAVESSAWSTWALSAGLASYTGTVGAAPNTLAGPYDVHGWRTSGTRIWLRGWIQTTAAVAAFSALNSVALPSAARPAKARALWASVDGAPPTLARLEVGTDGFIRTYRALATGAYLNLDTVSYER